MKRLLLLTTSILILVIPTLTVFSQGNNPNASRPLAEDRFRANLAEPDGFLGLRLGNSFRYAEELFGEPNFVRTGSLDWRFASADFDPYEGLSVLGEKRTIDGFIAFLRPNRIQFTDMDLRPKVDKFGAYSASKQYVIGKYMVTILVQGYDSEYVRRIIMQTKKINN
ncbi:MAG: hypothetical protein HY819_20600 [Acidobacteria bacterium]|nr:hypothetical protein [Acidobacteriota bacterium]